MADRMSDTEALMWNLEKDPALRAAFLNVTFLDRPPDLDRLRRRMHAAVPQIPRLAQRVVPAAAGWGPPAWRPDPQFNLDHHVRRIAVPPPGDDRQLLDLAAHYQGPQGTGANHHTDPTGGQVTGQAAGDDEPGTIAEWAEDTIVGHELGRQGQALLGARPNAGSRSRSSQVRRFAPAS